MLTGQSSRATRRLKPKAGILSSQKPKPAPSVCKESEAMGCGLCQVHVQNPISEVFHLGKSHNSKTGVGILQYHLKRHNFLTSRVFFPLLLPPPSPPAPQECETEDQWVGYEQSIRGTKQSGGSRPGSVKINACDFSEYVTTCSLCFLHREMRGEEELPPGSSRSGFS